MIAAALHLARFFLREICPPPLPPVPERFLALGERAMELTRRLCQLGSRHPGSDAHAEARDMICSALGDLDCHLTRQPFTARTPVGPMAMCNVVARFGTSVGPTTVLSGHYDTIRPEVVLPTGRAARCWRAWRRLLGRTVSGEEQFVGANDGGSSTALLLEMARLLDGLDLAQGVWVALEAAAE